MDIQFKLPFTVLSFNTDNGTEFLNRSLYLYFAEKETIDFTRSRPYKKNDNCHVEQKNWTHVRENIGYERYDLIEQVEIMNIIYKLYLNNLYNFFVPQLKLIEKVRVGSKIVKKYDQPKTPYQRLLESSHLTMGPKLAESGLEKFFSHVIENFRMVAEVQGIPYQVLIRVFILDGLGRLKKAA